MEYMRLTLKPGEMKKSQSGCRGVQRKAGGKAQNKESESQGRASGEEGAIARSDPAKGGVRAKRIHKVWDPGIWPDLKSEEGRGQQTGSGGWRENRRGRGGNGKSKHLIQDAFLLRVGASQARRDTGDVESSEGDGSALLRVILR